MSRRTSAQREADRRADELAKTAKRAPRGRKLKLALLAQIARTEALKMGPQAR